MKICFVGAGALGSALGGALARGGHEVVLVDKDATHVEAIRSAGLRLVERDREHVVRVNATTACDGLPVMGLVVVLVKSAATREAAQSARGLVGTDTVVMSIQNGLGHEEILADVFGRARVLGAKTWTGGTRLGPGHVLAGIAGKQTFVGELDGSVSDRVRRVAEAFSASGIETVAGDRIVAVMWEKLLINVATAALTGITRLPYGPLQRVPEVAACAIEAVAEAVRVATAGGIPLRNPDPKAAWEQAWTGLPHGFKPSLLQSVERGEATEIDFINGAVVRWGERLGIDTPVNRTLVACVKGIERGYANPGARI
jgi:2-dehydropantoate 2-reductase